MQVIIAYITEAITYVDDAPDEAAYLETLLTICEGKVCSFATHYTCTPDLMLFHDLDLFGDRKGTSNSASSENQGERWRCSRRR